MKLSDALIAELDDFACALVARLLSLDLAATPREFFGLPARLGGLGLPLTHDRSNPALVGTIARTLQHGIPIVRDVLGAALAVVDDTGRIVVPVLRQFCEAAGQLHPSLLVHPNSGALLLAPPNPSAAPSSPPSPLPIPVVHSLDSIISEESNVVGSSISAVSSSSRSLSDQPGSESPASPVNRPRMISSLSDLPLPNAVISVLPPHRGAKSLQETLQRGEYEFIATTWTSKLRAQSAVGVPMLEVAQRKVRDTARRMLAAIKSGSSPSASAFINSPAFPHLAVADDALRYRVLHGIGESLIPFEYSSPLAITVCPICHASPGPGHERCCTCTAGLRTLRHDLVVDHLFRFLRRLGFLVRKEVPINEAGRRYLNARSANHANATSRGIREHGTIVDLIVQVQTRTYLIDVLIGDLDSTAVTTNVNAALTGNYTTVLESRKELHYAAARPSMDAALQRAILVPFCATSLGQFGSRAISFLQQVNRAVQQMRSVPELDRTSSAWYGEQPAGQDDQCHSSMLWAELGAVIARTNFAMLTRYRDRVSGVIGRNPQLSFSLETRAMLAQVEDRDGADDDEQVGGDLEKSGE